MLFQNMFDSKVSSVLNSTDRCENHYSLFSAINRDIWNDQPSRQGSLSSNLTDSPPMNHRVLSRENSISSNSSSLSDPLSHSSGAGGNVKNLLLYKTELCRSYEESGTCRYSEKCQFAHGVAQLRDVPRHPKYKTQICRTFWEQGNCPYGKRCCFIHTAVESKPAGTEDQWNPFFNSGSSVKPSPSMAPTQKPIETEDYTHPRAAFLGGFYSESLYSRTPHRANSAGGIRDNAREDLAQFFWNSNLSPNAGKQGRLQVFQNFR